MLKGKPLDQRSLKALKIKDTMLTDQILDNMQDVIRATQEQLVCPFTATPRTTCGRPW